MDEVKKGKLTDDIFLKYLMCRPGMRLHIYNTEQPFLGELLDIEYYKHLILNQKEYENLILQLKSIRFKFEDIKPEKGTTHNIHIYFTESKLETYLDPESDLEYIHGTKSFIETTINAKTLLNPLAIKYLNLQIFNRIIKYKNAVKHMSIFLSQIYKNFSLFEIELMQISSGTISFSLGIRENTDFDITVYVYNKLYNILIKKLANNVKVRGMRIDVPETKDKIIENYYTNINIDSIKLITKDTSFVNNYNNLYFNPKYYYYFYGFKYSNIMTHMYWRTVRGRPAQIAELIAYNKLLNIPVPFPKMPEYKYLTEKHFGDEYNDNDFDMISLDRSITVNNNNNNITQSKHEDDTDYYIMYLEYKYYNKTIGYLKKFDPKTKKIKLDTIAFIKTIKMYLKRKYNINMTSEEIRKLLTDKGVESIKELQQFIISNHKYYI